MPSHTSRGPPGRRPPQHAAKSRQTQTPHLLLCFSLLPSLVPPTARNNHHPTHRKGISRSTPATNCCWLPAPGVLCAVGEPGTAACSTAECICAGWDWEANKSQLSSALAAENAHGTKDMLHCRVPQNRVRLGADTQECQTCAAGRLALHPTQRAAASGWLHAGQRTCFCTSPYSSSSEASPLPLAPAMRRAGSPSGCRSLQAGNTHGG